MKKMYKIKNISDKEINFFHAKFLKFLKNIFNETNSGTN